MMIPRWTCNLTNLLILNLRYFAGCAESDLDGSEPGGIVLVALMAVNRPEEMERQTEKQRDTAFCSHNFSCWIETYYLTLLTDSS